MKKETSRLIYAAGLAVLLSGGVFAQKSSGTYNISTKSSSIEWNAKKITGEHSGVVLLKNGSITVKDGILTGGEFDADMTTISATDLQGEWKDKLDGHLKSDDFFSVDKHPTAKFVIKKAEQIKGKEYKILGSMTIKGITNDISFNATVDTDGNKFAAFADVTIDRTKWDIKYGSNQFFEGLGDKAIYDDFTLKIRLGATK
jgi:polyisoprenoid-binding protein YceI